ncbi:MAG TPA: hypothetical protein VD788_01885, partial [Candidatus Polarisedimenticolaceae bacterium]|nr:hypothetical protein [Candidatus Polarisedimenticolaceae bacterium]
NRYGRVRGGVFPRSVHEQNEVSVPLPAVGLTIDGNPVSSDVAGRFDYGGGAAVSGLDGPWFATDCQGCLDPTQAHFQFDLGAGYVDFGIGGVDQFGNGFSTRAERNTFYHLNQVRRIALKWLPGLPWLFTSVTSVANIDRACNAFYDGNVNFFRASGICNNTGEIADVITHEWGHGIDEFTLLGDLATGEGTADVVALHSSHSPVIGEGFRFTGEPVRNLDPAGPRGLLTTTNLGAQCTQTGYLGPLGYEAHCEGEIYGQTAWELSQALVAKYGHHTGWRVSERLFYTSLPDAGGYLPSDASPIYAAYLNADDDDGNLANGTPNAAEIFDAFDRHGIAGAAVPSSTACTPPAQPAVSVVPTCGGFDLSWAPVAGAEQYRIFRGELLADQALFPVVTLSGDRTSHVDLEVAEELDYWYVVTAVDSAGCESTIEAPVAVRLPERPRLSIVAAIVDDTPRGNRSGFADPGEEVDLVVDLQNLGSAGASSVGGTITPLAAGIELLDAEAAWPDLAPGATAANLDTLRFRADSACGSLLAFEFVPYSAAGCAPDPSYFTIELGDGGVCDPTPACFVAPTFAGLDGVAPGGCGESWLTWPVGQSHCENATLAYNVYRSTTAGFVPSAATLVASGVAATTFQDTLLVPDQTYHYIVRADDSRSGEDANLAAQSIVAPGPPDVTAP